MLMVCWCSRDCFLYSSTSKVCVNALLFAPSGFDGEVSISFLSFDVRSVFRSAGIIIVLFCRLLSRSHSRRSLCGGNVAENGDNI